MKMIKQYCDKCGEENSYHSIRENDVKSAMNPLTEVNGFIDVDGRE